MGPAWWRVLPAYVLGAALGGLLGLIGAFLVPSGPVPGLTAGVLIAVAGNVLVPYHLGRAARTVVGAVVPVVAWLCVAVYLGIQRPEGDLVVTAELSGLMFLVLGAVAGALTIPRTRLAIARDIARDAVREAARAAAARADEPSDPGRDGNV